MEKTNGSLSKDKHAESVHMIVESENYSEEKVKSHAKHVTHDNQDGGYGWVIVASAFINFSIIGGHVMCFSLLYPAITEYYTADYGVTGWIGSFSQSMVHMPAFIYSGVITKYGCRICNMVGGCVAGFGYILSYFTTNIYLLYFTYGFITGAGIGLMNLSNIVIVQCYFNKKRALAFGLANSGVSFGIITMSLLVKYLLGHCGWKGTMLIFGAICFHGIACGLLFPSYDIQKQKTVPSKIKYSLSTSINESDQKKLTDIYSTNGPEQSYLNNNIIDTNGKHQYLYTKVEKAADGNEVCDTTPSHLTEIQQQTVPLTEIHHKAINKKVKHTSLLKDIFDFSLLKRSQFMMFCIAAFCVNIGMFAFYMHTPSKALYYNPDADLVGWLPSAIAITTLVCRIITSFVTNMECSNRTLIYAAGILLGGVVEIVYIFFTSIIPIFVFCLLLGITIGMHKTVQSTVLVDLLGKDKIAKAQALLNLFTGTSSLLATPLAGILFDMSRSYTIPFLVCGLIQAAGSGLVFVIYCKNKQNAQL